MDPKDFPILEHDPTRKAVIEPSTQIKPVDVPEHCVPCFFQEVIAKLCSEHRAREVHCLKSEIGKHPVYEISVDDQRLAVYQPGLGAPLAGALLEEVIALGCRKFIVCGSAGVLDTEIAAGHVIVPESAVRDEGTSYHYLPPAREVDAHPAGVTAIRNVLDAHGCDYLVSKTWTTDAFYRETPEKILLRKSEGCLTVEMEAAAFFAVAKFRGIILAQLLYGGDDVSGADWDIRDWHQRTPVRERLFWLAAEACLRL